MIAIIVFNINYFADLRPRVKRVYFTLFLNIYMYTDELHTVQPLTKLN